MRTIADSVTVEVLPSDVDGYAGYVDGRWPTYPHLPVAHTRWSIATVPTHNANWLDVETGDAYPEDIPKWLAANPLSGIYCTPTNWKDIVVILGDQPKPPWWAAHPGKPTLYPGSVATQYTTVKGYDLTIAVQYIPGIDKEPDMLVVRDTTTNREYLLSNSRLIYIPDAQTSTTLQTALGPAVPCNPAFLNQLTGWRPNTVK